MNLVLYCVSFVQVASFIAQQKICMLKRRKTQMRKYVAKTQTKIASFICVNWSLFGSCVLSQLQLCGVFAVVVAWNEDTQTSAHNQVSCVH